MLSASASATPPRVYYSAFFLFLFYLNENFSASGNNFQKNLYFLQNFFCFAKLNFGKFCGLRSRPAVAMATPIVTVVRR